MKLLTEQFHDGSAKAGTANAGFHTNAVIGDFDPHFPLILRHCDIQATLTAVREGVTDDVFE